MECHLDLRDALLADSVGPGGVVATIAGGEDGLLSGPEEDLRRSGKAGQPTNTLGCSCGRGTANCRVLARSHFTVGRQVPDLVTLGCSRGSHIRCPLGTARVCGLHVLDLSRLGPVELTQILGISLALRLACVDRCVYKPLTQRIAKCSSPPRPTRKARPPHQSSTQPSGDRCLERVTRHAAPLHPPSLRHAPKAPRRQSERPARPPGKRSRPPWPARSGR